MCEKDYKSFGFSIVDCFVELLTQESIKVTKLNEVAKLNEVIKPNKVTLESCQTANK